jgi:hypothetical protein
MGIDEKVVYDIRLGNMGFLLGLELPDGPVELSRIKEEDSILA